MAQKLQPRVLYCTHTHPDYIPPPPLSENLVACGPKLEDKSDGSKLLSIKTPKGHYDIKEVLNKIPAEQYPEVLIVFYSIVLRPINLNAFKGPKVLLIGDTHHLRTPFQNLKSYTDSESFDYHIILFNRHHAQILSDLGLQNLYWLPNLTVTPYQLPFAEKRREEIVFVGQTGGIHPRRTQLIQTLQQKGFPIKTALCHPSEAAHLYSEALITFNCSLNGDLNMRVFEVLAAGGFLMTDCLSSESGLEQILKRDKEYVSYDSAEELCEQVEYFLDHSEEAVTCARQGQSIYNSHYQPSMLAAKLWDLIFNNNVDPLYELHLSSNQSITAEKRMERIAIYEVLQEIHRQESFLSCMIFPGTDLTLIKYIIGLPNTSIDLVDYEDLKWSQNDINKFSAYPKIPSPVALDKIEPKNWQVVFLADSESVIHCEEIICKKLADVMVFFPDKQASTNRDNLISQVMNKHDFFQHPLKLPLFSRNRKIPLEYSIQTEKKSSTEKPVLVTPFINEFLAGQTQSKTHLSDDQITIKISLDSK